MPMSLTNDFISQYKLNGIEYNLLYSIYAFPNIILPFLNGSIADIIGFNSILFLSFLLLTIAQFLIWISSDGNNHDFITINQSHSYLLLLIGRCIFGIGSESFLLLITPMIYSYFKQNKNQLSMALALYFTISRLGTMVILITSYYIDNDLSFIISIGLYIFCGCLLLIICIIIYRIRTNKYLISQRAHTIGSITSNDVWNIAPNQPQQNGNNDPLENDINTKLQLLQSNHAQVSYNTNNDNHNHNNNQISKHDQDDDIISTLTTSKISTMFSSHVQTSYFSYNDDIIIIGINRENKFKLSHILQFNKRYWFLIINCCLISAVILPFLNIGSLYLEEVYGKNNGNLLIMIIIIICSILTPILNILIEKYGGRCQCLLLSSIILSISHFILAPNNEYLTENYYPIMGLCGIGISYSLFTAIIWPSFALVVTPDLLPTAYCIQMVIYNINISVMYIIIGRLMDDKGFDNDWSYNWKEVNEFFVYLSIGSICTVILLWYFDERYLKSRKQTQLLDKKENNKSELLMSGYQ